MRSYNFSIKKKKEMNSVVCQLLDCLVRHFRYQINGLQYKARWMSLSDFQGRVPFGTCGINYLKRQPIS